MRHNYEYLRQGEDNKEVEEETGLGFQVVDGATSPAHVQAFLLLDSRLRAFRLGTGHLELQPHVPYVQGISHAAQHRHRDGKPPVDEETQACVAYGERVEEEGVDG